MTPTIRYAASPAGRIAYSLTGSGPALLCDSGWVTHLRGQLDLFAFGPFVERLAERFTVIRYDKPGCGLSDRDGIDLSFEGQVAAALAVADAARADHFSVFGASQGGQIAAAIAARHPGRVDALALFGTCARGSDLAPAGGPGLDRGPDAGPLGPGIEGPDRHLHPGPGPGGDRRPGPADEDERIGGGGQPLLEIYYGTDVRTLLPDIQARTAVLHREADPATAFELGREAAALIPDAALIPLPGSSHLYYHGEWTAVLEALLGFLGEPDGPAGAGRG